MATVHDAQAVALLEQLEALNIQPEGFRAALDQIAPGWRGNADPLRGYVAQTHSDAYIKVARALYDVLPTYAYIGFDWTRDHGFGAAVVYLEQPARTAQEITDTIAAAKAHAASVAAAA